MRKVFLLIFCFIILYFIISPKIKVIQDNDLNPDYLFRLDSLYLQKNNKIPFSLDSSILLKDHYFSIYEQQIRIKNLHTRFEYLRENLIINYEVINYLFMQINNDQKYFIHQKNRIPAYVEYDIYVINHSSRRPVFTKKTRSERWVFIDEIRQYFINHDSNVHEDKLSDMLEKLNESIVNDYILYVSMKSFRKYSSMIE